MKKILVEINKFLELVNKIFFLKIFKIIMAEIQNQRILFFLFLNLISFKMIKKIFL